MNRITRTLGVAVATLCIGSAALAGNPPDAYYPPDVRTQFLALTERADALGYHLDGAHDPTHCYHLQGVARSMGPETPYMFISQSGNDPGGISAIACIQWCDESNLPCTLIGDGPGHLYVVKMESRERDGERLRSNRIVRGVASTASSAPDARDRVVTTIAFDGQNGWPAYGHAGGMAVVGDVLAVALEHPYSDDDIANDYNRILFIDIADPENPRPLSSLPVRLVSGFSVGAIAIAPMPNGRYLMVATGLENRLVRVYESEPNRPGDVTDLRDPNLSWVHAYSWRPEDDPVQPPCWQIPPQPTFPNGLSWGWPEGNWDDYAHQSLTFVREGGPTGQLYMIGARNSNAAPLLGDDMLDLYRVNWDGQTFSVGCAAQKHLYAHPSADGALLFHDKLADFAAGSGVYVSPTGELIVYATEHDNDGPQGSIKSGEWRDRDMARPSSPTLDPSIDAGGPYAIAEGGMRDLTATPALPATKAWVQLWTDPNWTDDRYLVIDYLDRDSDDFQDFERLDDAAYNPFADGFGDQATSARWFSPAGCTIHLNRDDITPGDPPLMPDKRATVGGEGTDRGVAHLDDLDDDAGDHGMDDSISSVVFRPDCDVYYDPATLEVAWDLDGDATFETAGRTIPYSAALLDGPTWVSLDAQVRHPMDGRTRSASAEIEIYNIAPVLGALSIRDGAGREVSHSAAPTLVGLPITLTAAFTDPGVADTQTASVDWHDGVVSLHADLDAFTGATGGVTGNVRESHAYAATAEHTVDLALVDDDGGMSGWTTTVNVLDARAAIEDVLARVTWQEVLDLLVGNRSGAPANGALDKLDAGDREAAVLRLQQAIDALIDVTLDTGTDTTDLQSLLALAAWSIAEEARADAVTATYPPSSGETRQLDRIGTALANGAALLAAGDRSGAADRFHDAVKTAVSLL